ncbi:hypothetical protein, partial [Nocardia brasiliensis]|uniref:hypothetical protein n=1 Tax=Nocardia brasiliensis TaxID=37326 RepID=UPI002457C578
MIIGAAGSAGGRKCGARCRKIGTVPAGGGGGGAGGGGGGGAAPAPPPGGAAAPGTVPIFLQGAPHFRPPADPAAPMI